MDHVVLKEVKGWECPCIPGSDENGNLVHHEPASCERRRPTVAFIPTQPGWTMPPWGGKKNKRKRTTEAQDNTAKRETAPALEPQVFVPSTLWRPGVCDLPENLLVLADLLELEGTVTYSVATPPKARRVIEFISLRHRRVVAQWSRTRGAKSWGFAGGWIRRDGRITEIGWEETKTIARGNA